MMLRVTSCGVGLLVALMASACQLVPNPALADGDASTGSGATTSASTSGVDGVDPTGPAGSTSTGPQDSTSTGPTEQLWCMDADADGFGDPAMCTQAVDMPPGTVGNGDDCDDGNPAAFPGAATNDDPLACMQDADGDGWGYVTPPAGVDLGTDCDDSDPAAFPGAAPNDDPLACMRDADGDDWGDARPSVNTEGGSDCYDANTDLNPGTLQLTAFTPYNAGPGAQRMLQTVDTANAGLGSFVMLETQMGGIPNINVSSATMDANGTILANDFVGDELYTVDYEVTCGLGTGMVMGLGGYSLPSVVSGLELAGDGTLYGVSSDDELCTFDPVTGQVTGCIPLTFSGNPINVSSVGMAYDCAQDRLLFANGGDQSIYSIDPATGALTLLRDLSGATWSPVGLAWNPVSRRVYLSTGNELHDVDIDDMAAPPVVVGPFSEQVSNLAYLPICSQ